MRMKRKALYFCVAGIIILVAIFFIVNKNHNGAQKTGANEVTLAQAIAETISEEDLLQESIRQEELLENETETQTTEETQIETTEVLDYGEIDETEITSFLNHYGFDTEAPFYEYYAEYSKLGLKLYFDEESEMGCGIVYSYAEDNTLQYDGKFAFQGYITGKWENPDIFSVTTSEGEDGTYIQDYQEEYTYDEEGKIVSFLSTGIFDWLSETENKREKIIEVNFSYRNDGTLERKLGYYSQWVFGTWYSTSDSVYDSLERELYRKEYITHGWMHTFYIYEGKSKKPSYCLFVDEDLSYFFPIMVKHLE